jgi:hypothetical protein
MPPTPHRDFLGYLQALGPLIAACAAVGVGVTQWLLQKQHLKQNLFDKRYKVYAAIDTFLTSVINVDGAMDGKAVRALRFETAHAEFLFGKDVIDFIGMIFQHSMDLAVIKARIDRHVAEYHRFRSGESSTFDVPEGELLTELTKSHAQLMEWIITAQVQCNEVFRSDLLLHHERPWYSRLKVALDHWIESADVLLKSRYGH